MKNIFISGSNGYIGKNLSFFLSNHYRVYGISRDLKIFSYCQNLGLSKDSTNFEEIKSDMKDSFFINSASIESKNAMMIDFYNVNLMHSLKLLEFCSRNNIPNFINLATTLDPSSSFYANSKHMFASQLNYLANVLELKALNLFLEPIYGPGMKPPRLIPYIFEQCAKQEAVIINSDKNLQRHFVNIEDLMTGIYSVIDSNEFFKSDLHIRGKKKYTLEEIVDKIVTLTNSNTKIKYLNNNAIAYDFECANNIPALQEVTSWIPRVSLQSGLKKILRDGPN
tara:strand:- start:1614 stop:2456 length:843 start_codon:yes stop_codon:yes gene_type:complete